MNKKHSSKKQNKVLRIALLLAINIVGIFILWQLMPPHQATTTPGIYLPIRLKEDQRIDFQELEPESWQVPDFNYLQHTHNHEPEVLGPDDFRLYWDEGDLNAQTIIRWYSGTEMNTGLIEIGPRD